MKHRKTGTDSFAINLAETVLRFRYLVILASILFAAAIGSGGRFLEFSSDYRVFFSDGNPELEAFEELQATYTKNDNFLFVFKPKNDSVFTRENIKIIQEFTESAWQIPYAIRVDSLSNFQHTWAEDDDLIVEDLYDPDVMYSDEELSQRSVSALAEPLLLKNIVTDDGRATAINVTLQYPQESLEEVPISVEKARQFRDDFQQRYPDMEIYLTGVSMLNNAFSEAGFGDVASLIPLMFVVIILLAFLILRSITTTFATLLVIILSTMVGMGAAGHYGMLLSPVSGSAPIIILTLAIADSIHILTNLRSAMQGGMEKNKAIVYAIKLNFMPVTITSITTIVGFLALNLSDSPPFWHLGNTTAVGIVGAWLFSLTFLPAMISVLPYTVSKREGSDMGTRLMHKIADFTIENPKAILACTSVVIVALACLIPTIQLNDQWTKYFDDSVEFRGETDQALDHFGLYPIEYSISAQDTGGVSEPEYLAYLEKFTEYLRSQDEVVHVYSLSDILKRLNKNLHADNSEFYVTPENRELSAQYLLLYELSLPYGLDLNDRLNIDKSASRVTATLGNTTTGATKEFLAKTDTWINANLPDYMRDTNATSAQVMFTYIAERNVVGMVLGTVVAIIAISIILIFALRSFSLGLISLLPNTLPIVATFGTWAILVGEVGFSVATIASISLGIVVDDTVHLLAKYVRARREENLTPEAAVRYALGNVGVAILVNTVILTVGFIVLTTSTFKINVDMGVLTALAIVYALVLDFLFLPAFLLTIQKNRTTPTRTINEKENGMKTRTKTTQASGSVVASIALCFAIFLLPMAVDANTSDTEDGEKKAYEIAKLSDSTDHGFKSSKVELSMVLRNASGREGSRALTISTLEVSDDVSADKSLVLFSQPRDVNGTALLSHSKITDPDDQWLYLPALRRVKRISSANKSGPFVGSEFAFEDITAHEYKKFSYDYLETQPCGDLSCDVIVRYPRYERSGYSKQHVWVDKKDHQLRKIDYYDRRGSLLKTLSFKEYRQYPNKFWRSHRLEMVNHQTKKTTDLVYGEYEFDVGIDESYFLKGKLSRMK